MTNPYQHPEDRPVGALRATVRAGVVYAIVSVAVIEFADVVFPYFGVAAPAVKALIVVALAGLPLPLALAWNLEFRDGALRMRRDRGHLPRAALLVAVGLAVAGLAGAAGTLQDGPPRALDWTVIEIYEPTEWRAQPPAPLAIQPKTSIMVHGMVRSQGGVSSVVLEGRRMSMGLVEDGLASFSGFVEAPAESTEIEILVLSADGRYATRRFPVRGADAAGGPVSFATMARSETRRRLALVVGISRYTDPNIPDKAYAHRDARALYDFLRSPAAGLGGFDTADVVLLTDGDATRQRIVAALMALRDRSTRGDAILLYFAGHGFENPDDASDFHLVAHDTRADDLAASAVPMSLINDVIREAPGYIKVLVADLGDAGGLVRGATAAAHELERRERGRPPTVPPDEETTAFAELLSASSGGFVAFVAAADGQLPQEGEQWRGGHGVFTHYLLEGLAGGADRDGDGVVTLQELMEYTRDRVRRETRNAQIPTMTRTSYDRFWPMAEVD